MDIEKKRKELGFEIEQLCYRFCIETLKIDTANEYHIDAIIDKIHELVETL